MKRRELVRELEGCGARLVREGGGHTIYQAPSGTSLVVPRHTEVSPGVTRKLLQAGCGRSRDRDLSAGEFRVGDRVRHEALGTGVVREVRTPTAVVVFFHRYRGDRPLPALVSTRALRLIARVVCGDRDPKGTRAIVRGLREEADAALREVQRRHDDAYRYAVRFKDAARPSDLAAGLAVTYGNLAREYDEVADMYLEIGLPRIASRAQRLAENVREFARTARETARWEAARGRDPAEPPRLGRAGEDLVRAWRAGASKSELARIWRFMSSRQRAAVRAYAKDYLNQQRTVRKSTL